jgi:hypothetical protein
MYLTFLFGWKIINKKTPLPVRGGVRGGAFFVILHPQTGNNNNTEYYDGTINRRNF